MRGVVVKDEEKWGGRSQHLITDSPLTDYVGTSWGLLSGRARLVVSVNRPADDLPGTITGNLTIDGVPVQYHRLDPRFNEAEEFGPLAWVIVFRDGDADVTIAGIEIDDMPATWTRIDTQPFRDARLFVLGLH